MPPLTKASIVALLDTRRDDVLGRALVALKNRQTTDEQQVRRTKHHNNIGFRVCDAYMGTAHAKHWEGKGYFTTAQREYWWRPHGKAAKVRIYSYVEQLYKIAKEKQLTAAQKVLL